MSQGIYTLTQNHKESLMGSRSMNRSKCSAHSAFIPAASRSSRILKMQTKIVEKKTLSLNLQKK